MSMEQDWLNSAATKKSITITEYRPLERSSHKFRSDAGRFSSASYKKSGFLHETGYAGTLTRYTPNFGQILDSTYKLLNEIKDNNRTSTVLNTKSSYIRASTASPFRQTYKSPLKTSYLGDNNEEFLNSNGKNRTLKLQKKNAKLLIEESHRLILEIKSSIKNSRINYEESANQDNFFGYLNTVKSQEAPFDHISNGRRTEGQSNNKQHPFNSYEPEEIIPEEQRPHNQDEEPIDSNRNWNKQSINTGNMTSPFCSPAQNDNMTLLLSKTQYEDQYQSSQKSVGFDERPLRSTSDWNQGANRAEGAVNFQQSVENPKIYEQYNIVPNNASTNQKHQPSKHDSESESENNLSSYRPTPEQGMHRSSNGKRDDSSYTQSRKEQSGIPSEPPSRQSHPLNEALYNNNIELENESDEMSEGQTEERQSQDSPNNIRPSSAFDKRNPNTKKVELSLKQKARISNNPLAAALEIESDESPKPNVSLALGPQPKPNVQGDKLLLTVTSYKPKSKEVRNDLNMAFKKSSSPKGNENRIFTQSSDRRTPSDTSKSNKSFKGSNLKSSTSLKR